MYDFYSNFYFVIEFTNFIFKRDFACVIIIWDTSNKQTQMAPPPLPWHSDKKSKN